MKTYTIATEITVSRTYEVQANNLPEARKKYAAARDAGKITEQEEGVEIIQEVLVDDKDITDDFCPE